MLSLVIRNDLEIYETRNMSDKNRRFSAPCAIVKVTSLMIKTVCEVQSILQKRAAS